MRWMAMAGVAVALVLVGSNAIAQSRRTVIEPGGTTLTISAEGMSEAPPDLAIVTLGVLSEGRTAQAALDENSRNMTALVAALRNAGLADRDLQTARVTVRPIYGESDRPRRQITGYQASNSLRARVRDVENTGRVIDAAVSAGGNTVDGVRFQHQNPQAQLDTARTRAIVEARRRAEVYAEALGMQVNRALVVSEPRAARYGGDEIVVTGTRRANASVSYVPVVEVGEIETRAQINITFELRS